MRNEMTVMLRNELMEVANKNVQVERLIEIGKAAFLISTPSKKMKKITQRFPKLHKELDELSDVRNKAHSTFQTWYENLEAAAVVNIELIQGINRAQRLLDEGKELIEKMENYMKQFQEFRSGAVGDL